MNILRAVALAAVTMGITLFVLLRFLPGSEPEAAHRPAFAGFTPTATAASAIGLTPTPTPMLPGAPTLAPPPPPFDGRVARLKIPSLKIDYPIEDIGVLPNNELDTPHDAVGRVGWYDVYDKPGFFGNALFSAHVYYRHQEGPFWRLANIKPGDVITVAMQDGPEYHYRVFKGERVPLDKLDMGAIIWPVDRPEGREWITLITCGGRIQWTGDDTGEYLDRDVIVAERIS